jgi:hypothetical protein
MPNKPEARVREVKLRNGAKRADHIARLLMLVGSDNGRLAPSRV